MADDDADEWPPREARFRAALWRGEEHLDRREFFQAYRAFSDAATAGDADLARGLAHLAAAGFKQQDGDARGALRQLDHARRRLAPYLPRYEELDLARLLAAVTAFAAGEGSGHDDRT